MAKHICRACQGAGELYDIPTGSNGPDDDLVALECPDCELGEVDQDTRREQDDYNTDEACEEAAAGWAALYHWERMNDERERHD